jgi:hypothetical protein
MVSHRPYRDSNTERQLIEKDLTVLLAARVLGEAEMAAARLKEEGLTTASLRISRTR